MTKFVELNLLQICLGTDFFFLIFAIFHSCWFSLWHKQTRKSFFWNSNTFYNTKSLSISHPLFFSFLSTHKFSDSISPSLLTSTQRREWIMKHITRLKLRGFEIFCEVVFWEILDYRCYFYGCWIEKRYSLISSN
jgi:hypothetical protein